MYGKLLIYYCFDVLDFLCLLMYTAKIVLNETAWNLYRFVDVRVGRGRPLRRIWVGGRSNESRGWANLLVEPASDIRAADTFDGWTNVSFRFSVAAVWVSGVSPRLRLLFELPDERLCLDDKQNMQDFCLGSIVWKKRKGKANKSIFLHLWMKTGLIQYPNQFDVMHTHSSQMTDVISHVIGLLQYLSFVALLVWLLLLAFWMYLLRSVG